MRVNTFAMSRKVRKRMTDEELINNEKYHTCGRCKYEYTPDNKYPCVSCIYGTDHRTDLWELKEEEDSK